MHAPTRMNIFINLMALIPFSCSPAKFTKTSKQLLLLMTERARALTGILFLLIEFRKFMTQARLPV